MGTVEIEATPKLDGKAIKEEAVIDESELSPIEEVRLTVPNTDDPSLPLFGFRTELLVITQITVQVATLPIGRFMASVLPTTRYRIPGVGSFTLNPGPFNMKEHVLFTIFANAGSAFGGDDGIWLGGAPEEVCGRTGTYEVALYPCSNFSLQLLLVCVPRLPLPNLAKHILGVLGLSPFADGHYYNITSIVNDKFELDFPAYQKFGRVHLSTFFALTYGFGFATIAATVTHVALFYGREIYSRFRASSREKDDVHTRLMRNYKDIPSWWFYLPLSGSILAGLALTIFLKKDVQMPWWELIFVAFLAFFFTLPISIITATTNQTPGLNIITEYIMGALLPGQPITNVCFKTYGYMSMAQAFAFLSDFKLGHYMKIPPRSMFLVQFSSHVWPSSDPALGTRCFAAEGCFCMALCI
ncbi:hypothetical protein REPUB_Repub02eG0071600 [Reevesia pubescens]